MKAIKDAIVELFRSIMFGIAIALLFFVVVISTVVYTQYTYYCVAPDLNAGGMWQVVDYCVIQRR